MKKELRVGIIGGGVSGAVTALQMSNLGIHNLLFEKKENLVSGPPFCHLHAGGNLYPEIPLEECKTLLKQSIEMARLLPNSIDKRPTFIAIPKNQKYSVEFIANRLKKLKKYYEQLICEDPKNQILGPSDEYFKIYHEEDITQLAKTQTQTKPVTSDEWMRNAIEIIDTSKLKTPIILVQEYGWNFFRLAAQAQLALKESEYCTLKTNTTIRTIKDVSSDENIDCNWLLKTEKETYKIDYLVNSAGYKNTELEEVLNLHEDKHVEFKASYISKWKSPHGLIPEIIIHGERGTPNGMVQLTPYNDN
ncbi:MAG: FAD-dependent oxidoreductase, partial [Vicingaceae bacterium]|nr:FAD-dependent oxidoreductase [Vicingaceae bacterium]